MIRVMTAAVLTCVVATSGAPCPEVQSEPLEDGSLIRLRHNEPQALTAFLIEIVDYPGNRFAYMEDVLLRESIAAGKEKRIIVGSLMPGTVPDYLKVTAGIYAGGTTCGTSDKVKLILDARRRNLQLTRELISRIEKARSARESIENLTAELTAWARSVPASSSGAITHVAEQLKHISPDQVLAALRVTEQTYAGSKPTL